MTQYPAHDRVVSAAKLKQCKLWSGSDLETDFNYGGIRLSTLKRMVVFLEAYTDRTPNEDEWLLAIKETIAEYTEA